ncbi:Isochorismatase hydrolase [Melanomma pulvis-pyrius CBS 109.77]|uniref:Isochorismatase hydrolase n=1 Tax=Melanomma pulvis-pyrius CBS 109.77 TaxID=1314802 RepID=A0A6A6WYJ0_9PLEO|nr:Isochorismatase hydrolase [Melanomma pulvis-pyrius CBS 109.77]
MSTPSSNNKTIIGSADNFWLFDEKLGFDITHPSNPDSPLIYPRLTLQTSKTPVTLAPHKTAIVVIGMQNFFLSSAMGREIGSGHAAEQAILEKCIPAARKANIRILWLTWGISNEGLRTVPPMFYRNFGLTFIPESNVPANATNKSKQQWQPTVGGIGQSVGNVTLEDGTSIDGGRTLMKDQWNTELHGGLANAYNEGSKLSPADIRFHKETHSGFWGDNTDFARYIKREGLKPLLFAGVNTDQCVLATMQDAAQQGYDTIMLKDACSTVSPQFAQDAVEFNAHKAFGFQSSCDDLLYGAEHVEISAAKLEL